MSRSSGEIPPDRYLVPLDGLKVPTVWRVGRVRLHPGSTARDLIDDFPPFESPNDAIKDRIARILDGAADSSVAEVEGVSSLEDAVAAVRESLDALRVFQQARTITQTTSFGLPGDLHRAVMHYVAIWHQPGHSGSGASVVGHSSGWEFTQAAYEDWSTSDGYQFVSDAMAQASPSEGGWRARIGIQLLSRAMLEHRADLKMLGVVSALEAWLIRREPGAQTMRLARHVSWFGCGASDGDLCGRDRPICPYLHLDPTIKPDRDRLAVLRELGNTNTRWRCSEWHRVMDWYDSRSGAAHGDPTAVDADAAKNADYQVARFLTEPILDWLRTHEQDPVADLEAALNRIESPGRWEEMLAALDATSPPTIPPYPEPGVT